MKQEEFAFSDSNFYLASFSTLMSMREEGDLCDVIIKVEDLSFTAHKLVLATVIPYFRTMFTNNMKESGMKEITMKAIDPHAVECIMNFAYTNRLRINDDNVKTLLQTSVYLQVDSVIRACLDYMKSRVSPRNILTIRKWAFLSDDADEVMKNADCFIRENFEEVSKSEDFLDLTFTDLNTLISRNDLHVLYEEVVFESVIRWVNASEMDRISLLPKLLRHVRMHLLNPEYLSHKISSEELTEGSVLCKNIVEDAMDYHTSRIREATSFDLTTRERYCRKKQHLKCAARKGCGLYSVLHTDHASYICYYDHINERWAAFITTNQERYWYIACSQEKIYIIQPTCLSTLDLQTQYLMKQHTSSGSVEIPSHAGIALHNGKIYFFGGVFNEVINRKIVCLDLENRKYVEKGRMTIRRKCLSCASLGEDVYITGGQCRMDEEVSLAERYNFSTGTVSTISPMLQARSKHESVALNGKIYVCGGKVTQRIFRLPTSSCEVYDPSTDQWSFIRDMNFSWGATCLFTLENKLVAFTPCRSQIQCEAYDSESDEWRAVDFPASPGELRISKVFLTNSASGF